LVLPAFGITSDVVSAYTRRDTFSRRAMLFSMCLIGIFGCIV